MNPNQQGAPPAGVPAPWPDQLLDEAIIVERNKVLAATFSMIVMALVNGLVVTGAVGARNPRSYVPRTIQVDPTMRDLGIILGITIGVAAVFAVIMALSKTRIMAILCAAASAIAAGVLVFMNAWIVALFQLGATALVVNAIFALGRMRKKIDNEAERNPLVAHYRLLVRILVRMMAVDQHVDRREVDTIMRVCNSLRIDKSEQKRFLTDALDEVEAGHLELGELTSSYLELAQRAGIEQAPRTAMMAAMAVACADGMIGPEEEEELQALGRALGLAEPELAAEIVGHRAQFGELNPELARRLLNVEDTAPSAAIEEAYNALREDLRADHFDHIGKGLESYAVQRIAIVDKAYEVLKG